MNALDSTVTGFLNSFARRSGTFDSLVLLIVTSPFFKSAPLFAIYWYQWFRSDRKTGERREVILVAFLACLVALAVGRLLAIGLPARLRPIDNPALELIRPYGMDIQLHGWSSFPSDHAMFFVSLAVGIFALSRRLGSLALAHVVLLILIPRIYLGLHFATDILAGALIGAVIAFAFLRLPAPRSLARRGRQWSDRHAASFYTVGFIVTWQMATLFDDLRRLGVFSLQVIQQLIALAP